MLLRSELEKFQAEVAEWSQRNFPKNKPYHPLLGVSEEVGELCHAFLKAEQGIRGTPEEHFAASVDAVGDIVIYLTDFCSRNGISLADAIMTAWGEVRQRDWQNNKTSGKPLQTDLFGDPHD